MILDSLLNQTLTLQRITEADDNEGGRNQTPYDAGSFKGRIHPLNSSERLSQDKVLNATTHVIYCDNMDVLPTDRIKWGTYIFDIIGIKNPSELYHHLEIECKEINYPIGG
jgi:head-tail adaptor